MAKAQEYKIVDLDDIPDFSRFEISVNGQPLPIAIGDKIQFPKDDPYLKTIIGIHIDESGIASYIIEWFEDSVFKQNTLSLAELKVLKDNLKQRTVVEMFASKQNDEDQDAEDQDVESEKARQKKPRAKAKSQASKEKQDIPMNDVVKLEWVDKYRPKKLDEYVLNDNIRTYFKSMIQSKSLQNMTFAGCQGMGKTTLAKILCNEFDAEVLFVKCATEGTVDVLRSKVEPFCNAMSIEGKVKIVVLDELDSSSSTGQNNFQLALRTLIEAAQDDTRFICTCNFSNKVQPAVLSRCPIIPLKFEKKDLLLHIKSILDSEKVRYTKDSLKAFVEESFKLYPDCRQIINKLQLCSNSGELVVTLDSTIDADKDEFMRLLVKKVSELSNIMDVRSFYMQNKAKIDDYKTFGAQLFDFAIDSGIISDTKLMLKMSDIVYQMNLVVNPEIQFFAMVCIIFDSIHGR